MLTSYRVTSESRMVLRSMFLSLASTKASKKKIIRIKLLLILGEVL